jgi:hypothetical protein
MPRAILASFSYQPVMEEIDLNPVPPHLARAARADAEVFALPKFEVRSRRLDPRVASAIESARPLTPQKHTALGTGIRERDFGEIRAHVVTVLFVPVRFGISW